MVWYGTYIYKYTPQYNSPFNSGCSIILPSKNWPFHDVNSILKYSERQMAINLHCANIAEPNCQIVTVHRKTWSRVRWTRTWSSSLSMTARHSRWRWRLCIRYVTSFAPRKQSSWWQTKLILFGRELFLRKVCRLGNDTN